MHNATPHIHSFQALGTEWHITTPTYLTSTHKNKISTIVELFQDRYSRFIPHSLISRLNSEKSIAAPPAELTYMLHFALELYVASDGLFNISVGSQLEKDGYGLPPDTKSCISRSLPDDIDISPARIRIAEHVRLDLGGLGKGMLIDLLRDYLDSIGHASHIINGGGDIRVGCSHEAVFIEHPMEAHQGIGSLRLQNEALASSSNLKRQWKDASGAGKRHIVALHAPDHASEALQISVRAQTCLVADALATTLFIADSEQRLRIAHRYNASFMYVDSDLEMHHTPGFFRN